MRAIAVLLVPHRSCLPFEWQGNGSLENLLFLRGDDDLFKPSELSEELRNFTMELVYRCALEIMRVWQHEERVYSLLFYYNRYIIDFLKILPEDYPMAEKLFSVYQLNDSVVFYEMDTASGYNPLHHILNENLPEKWKRLVVFKMHEIITAEENGHRKPRAEHEEALRCYVNKIMPSLSSVDGQIRYSVELFASQIDFVLSLSNIRDRGLFESYNVEKILRIISEDKYKSLRHRFARYVVLKNEEEFQKFDVYDGSTKRAAEAMLAEFGTDKELIYVLKKLLDKAEKRFCEDDAARSRQKDEVQAVLSQMI